MKSRRERYIEKFNREYRDERSRAYASRYVREEDLCDHNDFPELYKPIYRLGISQNAGMGVNSGEFLDGWKCRKCSYFVPGQERPKPKMDGV